MSGTAAICHWLPLYATLHRGTASSSTRRWWLKLAKSLLARAGKEGIEGGDKKRIEGQVLDLVLHLAGTAAEEWIISLDFLLRASARLLLLQSALHSCF